MEKGRDWKKQLIKELTQGLELSKQLQIHLGPSSTNESRESLVQRIQSSLNTSLSMLKKTDSDVDPPQAPPINGTDSPRSFVGSPLSEISDQEFKDNERREISKKRKTLPKWTEQVRVCSGTGHEGPLEDGFSWRKYGQKDILGAKFPRGYYRCTHRNVRGCLATKQVQKSDENPSIFEVTYRGKHTCFQASNVIPALAALPEKQVKQQHQPQMLLNFRTGLKVKTEDLDSRELTSPPFSFPSTSMDEHINLENHIFSPSILENSFMGSFPSPFVSPTTSESNYFSLSPSPMNSCGVGTNFQSSESDLTEIVSASNSASNSPMLDLDFTLEEFDADFEFNDHSFFS